MKPSSRGVFLMCLVSFLQGMVFYGPVASLYRTQAGLSMGDIALIESVYYLLVVALELPLGAAAARLGYKRMLAVCSAVFFLSKLVFWRAGSFGAFLAERVMLAFVGAGLSGCDTAYLYVAAGPKRAQRALGLYGAAGMAGLLAATAAFTLFFSASYRQAALATAVSPIISIAICSRHFLKKENTLQFVRQMPSVRLLGQSCQLGISGFVGELSSGVTTTVFNFLLLGLAGNVGVAAYGVVANFALVATAIFNGVAQGAQPLVSRCYGQNDHAGARKLLLLGSGTVLVLAAVLYAAVFGLTDTLVSWFNSENSVQMAQYAHTGMRMYFVGYFFAGFNIMAAGYLSAVNRPAEASITSICRGMVAIVACSLLLSAVFGMPGVWAAFPASELLTALLTLFLLRRKKAETA